MTALVIRGTADRLPLPDGSVDLIVTSPPYYSLRSYTDGGQRVAGQLGGEATPAEYVAALLDCTAEWVRVLKPEGSIWVNLGDKYGERGGPERPSDVDSDQTVRRAAYRPRRRSEAEIGVRQKCLIGLPWRYALGCTDQLGLTLRAEVIWSKPNGLPESVTDRVRRSHETWFHLVKQPRYYSAVDAIRTDHARSWSGPNGGRKPAVARTDDHYTTALADGTAHPHPLGALPGSVWEIPTEPLRVPERLGVEHYAAFPTEWPRRLILGWSPPGICAACGQGRRPVAARVAADRHNGGRAAIREYPAHHDGHDTRTLSITPAYAIAGYVCGCTPYTDHPERRRPTVTPGRARGRGHQAERTAITGSRRHGSDWPAREAVREYEISDGPPPRTKPAVVLDPFGGTGTTALVASVLGRIGITVDLSGDYGRLAQWRTTDPGQRAHARRAPKPDPLPVGQLDIFGGEAS